MEYNRAPILCAGDVFDHWDAPAELVNWALEVMPFMYVVAGQHDLPYHSLDDLHKTSLGTLQLAGKVEIIGQGYSVHTKNLSIYGASYGETWPEITDVFDHPHLLLCHQYVYSPGHLVPNPKLVTPENGCRKVARKAHKLGFDVAVFGDNHSRFLKPASSSCTLYNCGNLQRRKINEGSPAVGVLMSDKRIIPRKLHTQADIVEDVGEDPEIAPNEERPEMEEFLEVFSDLVKREGFSFKAAVQHYIRINKPRKALEAILLECLSSSGE